MGMFRVLLVVALVSFPAILHSGCSGGGNSEIEVVDPSTLPPEQAIIEWASAGNESEVESLLKADPSLIDLRDDTGKTPLHFAAAYGHKDLVKFLLDNGADPLATDDDGELPADAAGQMGETGIAEMLMEAATNAQ
jgi:ankyrin repeat protein